MKTRILSTDGKFLKFTNSVEYKKLQMFFINGNLFSSMDKLVDLRFVIALILLLLLFGLFGKF